LIRSVFVGLRTRRLGTRGNSKYHYYGIRVRPGSSVLKTEPPPKKEESLTVHLGDPKAILPSVWPEDKDESCEPSAKFAASYRRHFDEVIHAIGSLDLNGVQGLWKTFWQSDELKSLTLDQTLADWVIQTDYTIFNSIITCLLLPQLLKSIPQTLTQQIRNFAKNIEQWMESALQGFDPAFVAAKLQAVNAFSHTLRRYTSLNHLSSAARAVLENQQQIQQMVSDLNRVDFRTVQEQASWVCGCDDELVQSIERSFKGLLQEEKTFENWGSWCLSVLDSCLGEASDTRSVTQFFFKWGFYSSLVMRDLTLRSASSFGSFHLIRLLFDEYIFYLIEQRVAKSSGKTPLQVLGEVCSLDFLTI